MTRISTVPLGFNVDAEMLHADVVIDHDPLNDSLKPGPSDGVIAGQPAPVTSTTSLVSP